MLAAGKLSSAAVVDGQVKFSKCKAEVNTAERQQLYGLSSHRCPRYTFLLGFKLALTQVRKQLTASHWADSSSAVLQALTWGCGKAGKLGHAATQNFSQPTR